MGATVEVLAKERLKSPRARLFVALDLPEAVRQSIAAWQRQWTDPALRPVPVENMHLTLAFLGYAPERRIERIAELALEVGEARAPEARLLPDPVAVPRGRRPRLFALDAEAEGVAQLQSGVVERLAAAGLHEPERRPFWPHLTVARVKPERRGSRRPALVQEPPGRLPEHTFLRPIPLVRLVLFRSHLRREGAVYEPLAELELPTD